MGSCLGSRKLVKEEIDGGNLAVSGDYEIGSGVSRRLARGARHPPDQTAIAQFLRRGDRLILEVRMSSLDHASMRFAGTVLDNIRYGNLEATEDEIIMAAKKANAHDFIMSLPNGYATDIGQRGVKLSGGQKQHLSVARVFLKNPPIIIFDEATSSLDNESEKAVQDALENLIKNRIQSSSLTAFQPYEMRRES